MNVQEPLPIRAATVAEVRCAWRAMGLIRTGRVRMPNQHVDTTLRFANGTTARIYRETVIERYHPPQDPCMLVVTFRLRLFRGPSHALFRWESLLNTPLFIGFPGYVSKLWVAHDEHDAYRGIYEWDGPERAEHYARSLWRVLAPVSVPGSIRYTVLPGRRRDEIFTTTPAATVPSTPDGAWWRVVETTPAPAAATRSSTSAQP